MCSCYAHLLLTQHSCCRKNHPPCHRLSLSCSLKGQCGPSWSLQDLITGTLGFAEFWTNLDKTPSNRWPLTTLPPPGDKPVIGAAADGEQHFSKQEEKPSCSAQRRALRSALVPGAVQISPLFLPQPLPLCNNQERREELLRSLPLQPDWGTWQRATCPGASSGAGLLGLGHRKRDFRRADELLRQPLPTKPSDDCQLAGRAPTAFYYCRKQRQSRDQW